MNILTVALIAGGVGAASLIGGALALWREPNSLVMSLILGFTSGLLIATVTLEMLPHALELAALWVVALGFALGFALIYGIDMFVHRGALAGAESEKREYVERVHRRWTPRGDKSTVLATGTSIEEVIEGLSIGVGFAVEPGVAIVIALAIAFDNLSEGLSIGARLREETSETNGHVRRVLSWTGLIGGALFVAVLVGWWLLRDLPDPLLAFLFAFAAGGLLYLTITDLLPSGQARHFQQSAALAMAVGFVVILVLSQLI